MPITKIEPEQLRRRCDPASFSFASTADLPCVPDIFGQPRATRAIEFGIGIDSPGFNIFVLGPYGSGRVTTIMQFLAEQAARRPMPDDWVYVHNFVEPYKPRAIRLQAGLGKALAHDMKALVQRLQTDLPRAFETEQYVQAHTAIVREFEQVRNEQLGGVDERAQQNGLALVQTPSGLLIAPVINEQVATPEALAQLPPERQAQLEAARLELEGALSNAIRVVREQDKATRARLQALDREVAAFTMGHVVDDLAQKYSSCPEVAEYLEEVRQDIIEHVQEFKGDGDEASQEAALPEPDAPQPAVGRYLVNVFVDNSNSQAAPVVVEYNPTLGNLLGRIEHDVRLAGTLTDFTMLRPGALQRANGGYLVLRAYDLLSEPDAYEALKRALSNEMAVIEDWGARTQLVSSVSLEPEPIPLDVKVLLWGSPELYYNLYRVDEDFRQLFKVRADFAADMDRTPENEMAYALFVRARCAEEGLCDFDPGGVAALVEVGSWLAEDQHKLSTRFGIVADIVREAAYWARQAGQALVTGEAVGRALAEWRYRANLAEERIRQDMLDGTLMIDTQGEVIGQVNGLTVVSRGDYDFGQPSRITARAFAGRSGLVAIEREVKMSGRIHNKGVLILQGYMGGQYAAEQPLTLSASISFEQLYSDIDGDSASSTELYALLSSLAALPLKQSLAATGSVNQRGEIQPVGGVQSKVEGFYDLCAARGLNGEQGVIIPAQNVRNLMLRPDIVQAVSQGRFHVWAICHVDEGLELLSGRPAGVRGEDGRYPPDSVHGRVEARLKQLAESAKKPEPKPDNKTANQGAPGEGGVEETPQA